MLRYLHELEPARSFESSSGLKESEGDNNSLGMNGKRKVREENSHISLILGGYSYGSMIASNLPPCGVVLDVFTSVAAGTAESAISYKASQFALRSNQDLADVAQRRGQKPEVANANQSHSHCTTGESSDDKGQRGSYDALRSMESLRQKVDRSLSHRKPHSEEGSGQKTLQVDELPSTSMPEPVIRFLLISPLLPPISSFTSLFTKPTFTPRRTAGFSTRQTSSSEKEGQLSARPVLAVYGDKDLFTSAKRLNRWAEALSANPNSEFRYREVSGAGQ